MVMTHERQCLIFPPCRGDQGGYGAGGVGARGENQALTICKGEILKKITREAIRAG